MMFDKMAIRLLTAALVGALASTLAACSAPWASTSAATPAVDPIKQAYLGVLRSDYVPWATLENQIANQCYFALVPLQESSKPQPEKQLAILMDCKPQEASAHAATMTLLDKLSAATPPATWQRQADMLKKGVQAYLDYHAEQALAINTNNVAQYSKNATDAILATDTYFCPSIYTFNAGPPGLDPALPLPPSTEADCAHK